MWGCVRILGWISLVFVAILFLILGGGYYYIGTASFARYVAARIERTLEFKLGRDVTIGRVIVQRGKLDRVVLQDVRIANVPGASQPWLATVREVEIRGGIESFRTRTIEVGMVVVRDPRLNVEIFPEGSPLMHNFPGWRRGEPRGYEIVRVDIDRLVVENAAAQVQDRRHDIHIVATNLGADVLPIFRRGIYNGTAVSPDVFIRIKDYETAKLNLRAAFAYRPGVLELRPAVLRGRGLEVIAQGKIEPLTEAVYDFEIAARTELARLREIFRVEKTLEGPLALTASLRGEKGDFRLTGDFDLDSLVADAYDLGETRGSIDADEETLAIHIDSAAYGGGTLTGDYRLAQYAEPYPMRVDLQFTGVSIEKLFADWDVENTGLRGAATGTLAYAWNKDDLLSGAGEGTARLARGAVAFGNARYPIPVSGRTDFALDRGVVTFRPSRLETPASTIAFTGSLGIEGLVTDLRADVTTRDFREIDRIAFNFARALDKNDFELLGLGGAGTIRADVKGPIETVDVVAQIDATAFQWNDVLLGDADLALRYDGTEGRVTFEPGIFRDGAGSVTLTGTVLFPERGPGPRFDLVADVRGYPAERIIETLELDLPVRGLATGVAVVRGTPDEGEVEFRNTEVVREGSRLALNGLVAWLPGEGNVRFDLDVAADSVPVSDIVAFLDLGELPVTGPVTGTLHLEGPKDRLEGAGSVVLRDGTIMGERVTLATADLDFHEGVVEARNVSVDTEGGTIRGEAAFDLASERFSYTLEPTELDLSRFRTLTALDGVLGGRLRIESTGAGTFDNPDLLINATLLDPRVQGIVIPPDAPPPQLYLAIRGGQLVVKGSAFGALEIDGSGSVGEEGSLSGSVAIRVLDAARLTAIVLPGSDLGAAGTLTADLELGGSIRSLEALRITATVPEWNITMPDHPLQPVEPIRLVLADGRLAFESFRFRTNGSQFAVTGYAGLTGDRRLDLRADGMIEAALLQLFVRDVRADGHMNVAAGITGTLQTPLIRGIAELRDAEVKLAGFPQLINDINGTLVFSGDRVEIDSLRASLGGGEVIAGGFIAIEGLRPTRFRVNMQGRQVSLRYFEGVTLDGNFDLLLAGDAEHAELQGSVVVQRALYYQDFDLTSSVLNLLLERRAIAPEIAASWQDRVALRVSVVAPDALAVRNNIADVTASADLQVRGTLANPTLIGVVELNDEGTIEFRGTEYQVVRGTVTFQNPFRIDPYFDITAEGRQGEYDLTINLTGTLDRITPTITSDPPTSDLTILSLLAPQGVGGGAEGGFDPASLRLENLSQAGGSLLLQTVGELIGSRIFPFADAFRLDTGFLGDTTEPRVTFEKQISDDIRAVVIYFLNASNDNIEIVEWQVTPDWTLQLVQDTRLDSSFIIDSVEGRFRRRYQGHWFSGARREEAVAAAPAGEGELLVTEGAPQATPEAPSIEPPAQTLERPIVASVGYQADAPILLDRVRAITEPLTVGEPMDLREVQSAIKALYATGDFSDVRLDAAPAAAGGVDLRFLLFVNYRVGEIAFDGLPVARARVQDDLAIRTGNRLSLNAVDRSAVAVAEDLRRRGWLEVTVDPEVQYDRAANRAAVTFYVSPGPQARVAAVEFDGDPAPFRREQLISRMRLEPGSVFRVAEARRDAERMQAWLVGEGYRRASVRYLDRVYDEATEDVTIRYAVDPGPEVRVTVEGVERSAVRRLLPMRGDDAYSEDAIDRAADAIRARYQSRGHYFARVDVDESESNGVLTVTYRVDPGPDVELAEVRFEGNETLPDDRLQDVVATATSGGFRSFLQRLFRRPSGVTDDQLREDVSSLEAFYRTEGFSEVEVGAAEVVTLPEERIAVVFPLVEGPRTIVTEVRIEGNETFERDDLPGLAVTAGEPLDPRDVFSDRSALTSFYGDRGHTEVQVAPRFDFGEGRTEAVVTYRISEGPEVRIDKVVVRGNTYTDPEVIERQSHLEPGDPFSYRSQLAAQRELYRLGIFSRVDIIPEITASAAENRNVVINVEEGRALTVGGSVGYSDERGPGGSASISHRNLFGTARFLGLEGRYFQRDRWLTMTYREPFVFDLDVPVQVTAFQGRQEKTESQIEIDRIGTFVEASRILGETVRWSARYEYRRVTCTDLIEGELRCFDPDTPRQEREIQISSVTPTVFWDRRDDALNPRRGVYASAALEYAFPFLAADASFLKGAAQGAWYLPVSERSTLAVGARIGLADPLAAEGPGSVIPFPERFTAGGESTHRAFDHDTLGTLCLDQEDLECQPTLLESDGEIYPLGGNALVIANVEYRFPLFGSLQGAAFVDLGNVYATIDSIDLGEVRTGAGAGLRYLTPLGPVRFDIGWKLDRKPWEDPFATFLTIGFGF